MMKITAYQFGSPRTQKDKRATRRKRTEGARYDDQGNPLAAARNADHSLSPRFLGGKRGGVFSRWGRRIFLSF